MVKKILYAVGFFCTVYVTANAQYNTDTALKPALILKNMRKVADWQIREFEEGKNPYTKNGWENGAMYTGIIALKNIEDKEGKYDRFLYNIGETNDWQTGPERLYADEYCVGQMYSLMYIKHKEPKMIEKFKALADTIVERRFDESLAFKNKVYLQEWAWCDALFMGPTALGYLSTATGNPAYLKKADTLWWKTSDYLYNKKVQLYFRDSTFFTKRESNGAEVFWSRGNGWVMGGLARVMDNMPVNFPRRKKYEEQFRQMAEKIASLQQADGSWHSSLLDPQAYNIKETSGTGFFCYALTWGINNKLLSPQKYLPVVKKAWTALVTAVHPDGKLGYVQAISDRPDKVDYESTNVYGAGAFLLAGSELYKLVIREK